MPRGRAVSVSYWILLFTILNSPTPPSSFKWPNSINLKQSIENVQPKPKKKKCNFDHYLPIDLTSLVRFIPDL